jgi:hypothetical protein
MATLTEVLGALLRDVAHARAQADMFSRQLSLEYLKDDLMRVLPVPRAEIRSTDVELGFAVSKVDRKEVSKTQITGEVLAGKLVSLCTRMVGLTVKVPGSRIPKPLREVLGDKRPVFEAELSRALAQAIRLKNDKEIDALLERQETQITAIERAATSALRVSLKATGVNVAPVPQTKNELSIHARDWIGELAAALVNALDRAKTESVRIDLAVTCDQLADIPEANLARVKLTVEIENYEWTEVETEDGTLIRKLVPR